MSLSKEQIAAFRAQLITSDYKGKEAKAQVLDALLKDAYDRGYEDGEADVGDSTLESPNSLGTELGKLRAQGFRRLHDPRRGRG